MKFIDATWLLVLLGVATWTTFFSFFNTPGIRTWRNLGLLACYLIGFVMLVVLPWLVALTTWSVVGIGSGFLYFCYECYSYFSSKSEEDVAWPALSTILYGLLFWPLMLPEAIEYWLADVGVLPSSAASEENG